MEPERQSDTFLTVKSDARSEINVKNSRFIAYLHNAEDKTAAEDFLNSLKRTYHDATHHCFAYVIGRSNDMIERFSDDGEPSGTAGKPILTALIAADLSDAVCVVVRYYGGTKLGVGGLGRAYGEAAQNAIKNAKLITKIISQRIEVIFPYDFTGVVERLMTESDAVIIKRNFGELPEIICEIPVSSVENFSIRFRDITRNKGQLTSNKE